MSEVTCAVLRVVHLPDLVVDIVQLLTVDLRIEVNPVPLDLVPFLLIGQVLLKDLLLAKEHLADRLLFLHNVESNLKHNLLLHKRNKFLFEQIEVVLNFADLDVGVLVFQLLNLFGELGDLLLVDGGLVWVLLYVLVLVALVEPFF